MLSFGIFEERNFEFSGELLCLGMPFIRISLQVQTRAAFLYLDVSDSIATAWNLPPFPMGPTFIIEKASGDWNYFISTVEKNLLASLE